MHQVKVPYRGGVERAEGNRLIGVENHASYCLTLELDVFRMGQCFCEGTFGNEERGKEEKGCGEAFHGAKDEEDTPGMIGARLQGSQRSPLERLVGIL